MEPKEICQMEPREELLENIAHLVSENRRLTADRDLYRDLWLKVANDDVYGMQTEPMRPEVPECAGAET